MDKLVRNKLREKGLKVTPQRVAIYEAVMKLKNHPSAENVLDFLKVNHPNISVATVYKVLDSLTEKKLLKKVKTENGLMRYDPLLFHHHHLYSTETEQIHDYEDEKLNKLLNQYFKKHRIKNFKIEEIQLQITGKFNNKK